MSELDCFRCLECSAGSADVGARELRCGDCGQRYAVASGVPILVTDWAGHEAEIVEAQRVNPTWYLQEQPPEQNSPWRHHLRKRRRYVAGVLRAELARLACDRVPRLLDLGCGDGTNLSWLTNYAARLYGSDYNLLRLSRARARLPDATLFLADILDYPAKSDFFDVVFFNHVIEHIEDDRGALATVFRVIRPGGLLILGTPNEGAWWWQWAYRRAPEVRETTDHVHFYTAETIAAKMIDAGFQMMEIEHLGWGPPDWYLDGKLRKYKILDDLFEIVGRVLLPRQASSLYLTARRAA